MAGRLSQSLRQDGSFNRRTVRELMRHWHEPTELERHPFARLQAVEALHRAQGLDYADALRQVVREAVDIAWPRDQSHARRRLRREIVEAHYLRDTSLKELAQATHMDSRSVRRILAEALDDLADALSELEGRAQAELEPSASATVDLAPALTMHPALIGRDESVAQLVDALQPTGGIVTLNGLPGSGKTAILAHVAQRSDVRRRFPDGALWADLAPQVSVTSMLHRWGVALGLSPIDLARASNDEALLAGMIRSVLKTRRLLIVLNDASSLDNVRKLLLGGPKCCHVVASSFSDLLLQLWPARSVSLPPLTPEASRKLIESLAPEVSRLDAETLDEIIAWCGGLPLALMVVGRHLARALRSNQQRRIETALGRLREAHSRLAMLADRTELGLNELRLMIQTSIAQISPERRRALHMLAALPPRPAAFDETTVLAVLDGDEAALDALVDIGLVECSGGLYGLHPVIHDVLRADALMASARQEGQLALVRAAQALTESKEQASEFSISDRTLLLAAAQVAVELGLNQAAYDLGLKAALWLESWGELRLLDKLLTTAHTAAGNVCDIIRLRAEHARILSRLGQAQAARHRAQESVALAERLCADWPTMAIALAAQAQVHLAAGETQATLDACARALARDVPDPRVRLDLLRTQGAALHNAGHYDEAYHVYWQALSLNQTLDATEAMVPLTYAMAGLACQRKRYDEAEIWLKQTLDGARAIGMNEYVALALTAMGIMAYESAQYEEAERRFAEAEGAAQRLGLPWPIAQLRHAQGALRMRLGRLEEAEAALREALSIAEASAWHAFAVSVSVELGECLLAKGKTREAERTCLAALQRAHDGELEHLAANLHYMLSRIKQAQGDSQAARALAEAAWQHVAQSGHHRAAEIIAWADQLRTASNAPHPSTGA